MRTTIDNEEGTALSAMLILLGLLALGATLIGANRALESGLLPAPLYRDLADATTALAELGRDERRTTQDMRMPGGTMANLRLGPRFEPETAAILTLELEERRRSYESLIARVRTLNILLRERDIPEDETRDLQRIPETAARKLGEFMFAEPARANVLLCALGWPKTVEDTVASGSKNVPLPFPAVPDALNDIPPSRLSSLLRDASDGTEPWLTTSRRLKDRHGLSQEQIRSLQCWLCRQTVQEAFQSGRARKKATNALQRHAALAPAQVRAALALRGIQKLLNSGPNAFGPLIDLLERRPDIAMPLLRSAVERWGLHRQAFLAASRLGGPDTSEARAELTALGPFGLDAVREMMREKGLSRGGRQILSQLRNSWPAGESALEILGNDPRLWRRWYEGAEGAL
jgi:hypothetical protein